MQASENYQHENGTPEDTEQKRTVQSELDLEILEARKQFKRRHGFQWPFHIYQMLSWLIYSTQTVFFFRVLAMTLYLSGHLKAFITAVTINITLTIVVSNLILITTFSDPTDPLVKLNRVKGSAKNINKQLDSFVCVIC